MESFYQSADVLVPQWQYGTNEIQLENCIYIRGASCLKRSGYLKISLSAASSDGSSRATVQIDNRILTFHLTHIHSRLQEREYSKIQHT